MNLQMNLRALIYFSYNLNPNSQDDALYNGGMLEGTLHNVRRQFVPCIDWEISH